MATATTEDWQLNKSVLESNKHMLENQLYCDVTFTFDTDTSKNSISAHKYMLISRSPVFCAMFTGPAKDENSEIRIEDVDKDSFVEMLRYFYYEEANLTGYNVLTVLYCAKKYMVSGLENLCCEFLEKKVNHTNVCILLDQATTMASLLGQNDLEEKCLKLIDESAAQALKSKAFSEIKLSTVEKIVKRDTLNIEEIDLFGACMNWAETECTNKDIDASDENKRRVLGNVISLIRFPVMELDDFLTSVGTTDLLTPTESLDVVLAKRIASPRSQLSFSDKKRIGRWKELIFTNLTVELCTPWYLKQNPELTTTFSTNISEGHIVISSIYFVNSPSNSIRSVQIQSASSTISKLENRFHPSGYELYEAAFEPCVTLNASVKNIDIRFKPFGKFSCCMQMTDERNVQDQDCPISMQNKSWYFIVGFKYKILSK